MNSSDADLTSGEVNYFGTVDGLLDALLDQGVLSVRDDTTSMLHSAPVVEVIQTHASVVLITRDRAYKIKKPNDFGFFDYSSPAKRRHFCGQEVRLNARLAPAVYLGLAPLIVRPDGNCEVGPVCDPAAAARPGAEMMAGIVVDYAVVMRRLPEEATLTARVADGSVDTTMLDHVARHMAAFHQSARADEEVVAYGGMATIRANWEENFDQMRPYVDRALDASTMATIENYVRAFLAGYETLFASRQREGHIRDCHGDLRLQHVYVFDDGGGSAGWTPRGGLAVVDCVEFTDRFRFGDVASEVAFLTMELDAAGRADLSHAFAQAYVAVSGDQALLELLPFYACYRACVRGKVLAFQLDEAEIAPQQRERARQEAAGFFALAASYARGRTTPALVMLSGLMGTGKSTLAQLIAGQTGFATLASDPIRKRLAGLEPDQPATAGFATGIYSPEWSARTYAALLDGAREVLDGGRSVVLDASFASRSKRIAAIRLAQQRGADAVVLECRCASDTALARLAQRWEAREHGRGDGDARQGTGSNTGSGHHADASDGRPDLYEQQRATWEAFASETERPAAHVTLVTERPLAQTFEGALDALSPARLLCALPNVGDTEGASAGL